MGLAEAIRRGKRQGKLHAEQLNDALPDRLQDESDVERAVEEVFAAGVTVDPEPPVAMSHCLLSVSHGPDATGLPVYCVRVDKDRMQATHESFEGAVHLLVSKISGELPALERDGDSFERLVRAALLREVLRALGAEMPESVEDRA